MRLGPKGTGKRRWAISLRGRRLGGLGSALPACLIALALAASPASAEKTHLQLGAFGSVEQPLFGAANALAVDQSSGDLLVVDQRTNTLLRYHADGTPSNFSALGTNVIDGKEGLDQTPENGLTFHLYGSEQQIAVDNSGTVTDGNIYVTQGSSAAGNLVDIFAADGEYLGQLTAAGEPGTRFGSVTPDAPFSPLGVAVDSVGNVYVGGGFDKRIYKFDPVSNPPVNGDFVSPPLIPVADPIGNLAIGVGSSAGSLFAITFPFTGEETALKIDAGTGVLKSIVDPGANRLLSVDPGTGHVYVFGGTLLPPNGNLGNLRINEYDAAGALVSTLPFNPSDPAIDGIAVDGASGRIYVSVQNSVLTYGPLVTVPNVTTGGFSVTGTTSVRLEGNVNPDGVALEECSFEYGVTSAYGQSVPCTESLAEIGTGPKVVHADVAGLTSETLYHYRLVAKNLNATVEGDDATVKTPSKPAIKALWSEDVGSREATLRAQVNPENDQTTYRVEWGTSPSYGSSSKEIAVGKDQSDHTVSLPLSGLQGGTTYHYRVVATNSIGITESADHTFITFPAPPPARADSCPNADFRSGPSASLPDCRVFEMVSPIEKANADIQAPVYDCCFLSRLDQSSDDGNRFSFSTDRSFADAVSSPYSSQYLVTRIAGKEWSTHAISPPRQGESLSGRINFKYDLEYKGFSPDLSTSWLVHDSEPQLDECAVTGFANLYRRDNTDDSYEALTTAAPSNTTAEQYWPALQGVSADGRVAVFAANGKLTADASSEADSEGGVNQVYEHVRDPSGEGCGELRLISVLPTGIASSGSVGSAGGAFLGASRGTTVDNAISEDGTRVFWSSGVGSLYLHEDGAPKTVLIASGGTRFWTAAADGSKAVYEVGLEFGDLFEYDVASKAKTLIASQSVGVAGASEDASRVYFVSKETLGGEGELGEPNLYLREGAGGAATTKLVATLAANDVEDVGPVPLLAVHPQPYKRGVRVTPDGASVVFTSSASLAGYDNRSVGDGLPSLELYRYEAAADELHCISCNPSGQRPRTREVNDKLRLAAQMPGWENERFAPRVLSDDGKRLFFESYDGLLPRDTNGVTDVYEWAQAPGAAECEQLGAGLYVASAGGCLSLISSGKSSAGSELVDATPSGSDVFIKTASSLLPHDPGLLDIYDARVGGGLPPPPAPTAGCEGEACQSPLTPPNDPTPPTAAFGGNGNVKAAPVRPRCSKPKVRRRGRCVKPRGRHKAQRKAKDKRRAGR